MQHRELSCSRYALRRPPAANDNPNLLPEKRKQQNREQDLLPAWALQLKDTPPEWGGHRPLHPLHRAWQHMRNNICCRRCPGSKRSHHLLQADSSQHRQSSCVLRAKSLRQFFWFCCPQTRGSTANRPMCCPRTASSRSLRCYAAGRPPAAKWKACAAGRLRAAIARAKDRLP